jgi:hypothetical protein
VLAANMKSARTGLRVLMSAPPARPYRPTAGDRSSVLQSDSLDERQKLAVQFLLAEAQHRLAERDAQGGPPADDAHPPPAAPPPVLAEHSVPVAYQPAESRPSALMGVRIRRVRRNGRLSSVISSPSNR